MSNKLLTIVIPVYNVERYIRQCLDSVIVSTELMEKMEILVINDGTPDKSALIAYEYAKKYPNTIKVIDKDNGGHGSAWNVGLKMATGKYLRFLDSDDWLTNLNIFVSQLDNIDSDLVFTHLNRYYEDSTVSEISKIKGINYGEVYSTSTFSYIETGNDYYMYDFWYCTYKTAILQKEYPLFVERVSYDDAILFLAPFILGETMYFMDLSLYNYRLGRVGQSVNQNIEKKRWRDYLKVCQGMISFANNHFQIRENQIKQRDTLMTKYINNRSGLFSTLSFKDYKESMSELLLMCEESKNLNIRLSPKLLLYKYTPSYCSWYLSRLFNQYILNHIK